MDRHDPLASQLDLTIFVACYNEEGNIVATLDTLQEALREVPFSWEVIVIDDGSTDRSVELVEQYIRSRTEAPLRLVVNETNRGLAQNYIEGAFRGRGKYYRLVCGDNVEDVAMLRHVFRYVGRAEMVLFYHAESTRGLYRHILSRLYTFLVNCISGHRLRYYNGLPILRRYDVMRWHTNYHGFGFQADLICRLLDEGFSYVEVPVRAIERTSGRSKALTLKNLLSVSHTFLDLLIRRAGRLINRRKIVRNRCSERLDLHAACPQEAPAPSPRSVGAGPAVLGNDLARSRSQQAEASVSVALPEPFSSEDRQ
jgi:glycosyltransferase involved in cell wall biosynthesis